MNASGDRCCNPFNRSHHFRCKGLRRASRNIVEKFPELKSKTFCTLCRLRLTNYAPSIQKNVDADKSSTSSDHSDHTLITESSQNTLFGGPSELSDLNSELGLPVVNHALNMLQQSPVPRKKLKQAIWLEQKLERTNNFIKTSLGYSASPGTSSGRPEFTEMLYKLQQKFKSPSTTRCEQIQILTLLPRSWSNIRVSEEFGASQYMVKTARKLCDEKGIMATPNTKLGRSMSEEIKNKVIQFYEDDQVSITLPGMKDFISVRDTDGQKVHRQKKLILGNLKELYEYFKVDNSDMRIGFSMFASLRPKHCILAGASGTHTVCVCLLHQNIKLMISACNLKKLTENSAIPLASYEDCLSMLLCPVPDSSCYLSHCTKCPGHQPLKDILLDILDKNAIEEIKFTQWVLKPRATLETYVKCDNEFVDEFCDRAKGLLQHSFIAKQQSMFLKSLKENLTDGECLVIMDFAENYAFVIQNAAPGFHWNNDQATVYPVVIYYKVNNAVMHKSLVIISDCLHHDSVAVHVYTRIVVDFMKSEIGTPSRIFYFTDGAPQQFKNYKNFVNLACHEQDFSIPAEWHFFATAHGKGPCDGIGGTLKRVAAKASLQLSPNRQILKPRQLFDWACLPGILPAIAKRFSGVEDYTVAKESLAMRFQGAKSIPSTQKQHCLIPTRDGSIITKLYSSSQLSETHEIFKNKNVH